jgi:transcriptional regulator with XRE-family HTH domain
MFDPEILRRLIEKSGMTPSDVARETKLTHTTISNLLNKGADPKISTLVSIARVLRVPVSTLIGQDNIKDKPPTYMLTMPKSMANEGQVEVVIKFV